MTVLSALQSAALRVAGEKPTEFFSSSQQLEQELVDLVNESAQAIWKAYDWRKLTKKATLVGYEGIPFDLPDDYGRMPVKVKIWSTRWVGQFFQQARSLDEWYYFTKFLIPGAPGYWILLDNKLQIVPAVAVGTNVEFYYISNEIVTGSGGPTTTFTTDNDSFVLDERLLTLDLIWRWRQQKRLEYAEDMKNFEIALSQEIARDKGSQVFTVGTQRYGHGLNVAYPGNLGE